MASSFKVFKRKQVRRAPTPGHTKIESTVRYRGIEVDDALAIAEQVDVRTIIGVLTAFFNFSD